MSISSWDSYDYMDSAETIERRNDVRTQKIEALKLRIEAAFQQWLYAEQVTLLPEQEKPSWAQSYADTQEGLTAYHLEYFYDRAKDLYPHIKVK